MAERFTCASCGRRVRETPHVTVTGRELCQACNDRTLGLAAGMVAGGGDPAQAIATAGWFSRLKTRRRKPPE